MKYGIIYMIRNNANNKIYFGQTIEKEGFNGRYKRAGEGIERVYNYHKYCEKNKPKSCNMHLLRAIEKYGFESFYIDECFDIAKNKEELDRLEKYYIILYDTINNGYNCKGGGSNGNPMQGKTEIEKQEWRNKLSKHYENKRMDYICDGCKKEFKTTPSLIKNKGKYLFCSNECYVKNIGKLSTGVNSSKHKDIICLTTNKIFHTQKEAGEFYNIKSPSHITDCCKGRRKYCGKLKDGTKLEWMFLKDYLKNIC